MTNLSIRTFTRWLTPWRTIRKLQTENQRLREQAVLRAAINQELLILAESRRLKNATVALDKLVKHQSSTAEPTTTAAARPLAVLIPMVQIPSGSFLMGSPEDNQNRFNDEGPQHEVNLAAFWMAQTPITQAQWREVASWQKVELDLDPDPSFFKSDQRPVERVSWFEAMEFCHRLSQRTGRRYTLPSEAQWEYACRAGTTTQFHFGDTLSPEQANCNTKQPTEVASFPANDWGLHDMHGNVWEWCLDEWHDNYNGAPTDGSAWVEDDSLGKCCAAGRGSTTPRSAVRPTAASTTRTTAASTSVSASVASPERRLLRGGSWPDLPADCRSAYRSNNRPDYRNNNVGFRVCCLPQD